jgi:DNA polymerase I
MVKDINRKVFLAIDANAIIHRAFHAYPSTLQTSQGIQVNAVYGFTAMLLEALEIFGPEYILCAMDTQAPTFRHDIYTDYKATRKPTDLSLVDQFPLVEEVLKSFNIPVIRKNGYEADDILGTISKYVSEGRWSNEDIDLYILTGDRDLLQLISDNVYVCLPNGNFKNIVIYERENTFKKFGYYPEQVVDYKAIVGDSSDNIPGIKGVGDKTVIQLLQKYHTLEGIYKNINEVQGRFKNLIAEGIEQAEFSRQLATIERNVGINIHLTDCILKDFDRKLVDFTFKKYAFKSLKRRLDDIFGKQVSSTHSSQLDMFGEDNNDIKWSNKEELKKGIKESKELRIVYIGGGESYNCEPYLFVGVIYKDNTQKVYLLKEFDIIELVKGEKVIFYNFEELVTYSESIQSKDFSTYYDILLAEHILHSEKRNLKIKDFAFYYSDEVLDDKISPMQCNVVLKVLEDTYLGQLSEFNNLQLYEYTKESIEEFLGVKERHLQGVLSNLELPISIILSDMESRGFQLDWASLTKLKEEVEQEIDLNTKEIYDIVGHEFNISSPKQLSDVLFNELGLPNKTKGSTKESVLRNLLGMHPIVEHLLYFREISKIKSTYVDPLYEGCVQEDDKYTIYTNFKQTGTTSGRFSSVNPNLQNLPLQGEWATKVRRCFVAREGFKLLGMDYSQMELRIMADISNDKLLIKDFVNGRDIHSTTAARVLNKELADITPKERSLGKTVNFGMIFGQTAFGLSSLLGIDREIAQKYISSYFNHYKGIEEYMRKTEYEAFEKGYVQTMFGTTRHILGIRSRNKRLQAASAREAINMPIQGSEADIMKLAMKNIYERIQERYFEQAYMLLQIHDEMIFEVKKSLLEEFVSEVEKIMLESIVLKVPLEVHISKGNSLSELK